MATIYFASFLSKITKEKKIEYTGNLVVESILEYIKHKYPEFEEIIKEKSIAILADGKSLILPDGKKTLVKKELMIIPVLDGGSS